MKTIITYFEVIAGSSLRVSWLWVEVQNTLQFYITQTKIVKNIVYIAEFVDETYLWHKRLCHMSEKGMHALAKMNVLSYDIRGYVI